MPCRAFTIIMLGLSTGCVNCFWPPGYRLELRDEKTFVISTADRDYDDESEDEMIRPEDLEEIRSFREEERKYEPLHSHVERYNERAARTATEFHDEALDSRPDPENANLLLLFVDDGEKPFIAGFKEDLDKVTIELFGMPRIDSDVRTSQYDFSDLEEPPGRRRGESIRKREEGDGVTEGDFVPRMNQNRLLTTEAGDSSSILTTKMNSATTDSGVSLSPATQTRNADGGTGIFEANPSTASSNSTGSQIREDDAGREITATTGSEKKKSSGDTSREHEERRQHSPYGDPFGKPRRTSTISPETEPPDEEAYDYENFKAEYYQRIEDNEKTNNTFNYTDNGQPEETAGDALKKIVEFKMPRNCTKEELTRFGAKALECLAYDYSHAKDSQTARRILERTWVVVKIWLCIYAVIAVPCWCQKGWCCCWFRCKLCKPRETIATAQQYYANNPPGVLERQPTTKGATAESVEFAPSLFELAAFEKFESRLRNL